MKIRYSGEISCTIDNEHPDIKCVENWSEDTIFIFSDTYMFDYPCDKDEVIAYIQRDLSLVAGGGYNTKHIHNVSFKIEQI